MTAQRGGCAFVTGGSSGIGLAAALLLARSCGRIALFARDAGKLAKAAERIRAAAPGTEVRVFPVDVADEAQVKAVVRRALNETGSPDRIVLSAGAVVLGETLDVPASEHRRVMDTNYFGTLWMAQAVIPHLRPGSALGLIGSAGGIVGIYGYAAYAPSKFALNGLADILRVELEGRGVTVTLCLPPDTETPMLAAEVKVRSAVTQRMASGATQMTAEAVAACLIGAMERGRFLALPNASVRALWWFAPVVRPVLLWWQARLLRRLGRS